MNRYMIISIFGMLLFTACQDMDLIPKDNLSDPLYWKTAADFEAAANTLYNSALQDFSDYNTDCDSDIAYALAANDISNGSWVAPDNDGDWNAHYANLRQANLILEKAATYSGDREEIKKYVAEARFFRAYLHWRLTSKFGAVPIVTVVPDVDSDILFTGRNPKNEVEDFILSELEDLYPDLPLKQDVRPEQVGRVTQGAALALKARVALYAGIWAKYHGDRDDYTHLLDQAVMAAQKVIDSGQYTLFEGMGEESYRYLFIEEGDDSPEDILSSRYYKDIRMHSASSQFAWGFSGAPTKKLADMYLCLLTGLPITHPESSFQGYDRIADGFENRDSRMGQTFLIPGTVYNNFEQTGTGLVASPQFSTRPETRTGYKLWKFMGEQKGTDTQAEYDYHVIRYAEVLLILAEATYEKNESISDEVLNRTINVIRSRKGVEVPFLTNDFVNRYQLDMREEIRRERTVELAFEGHRRLDLRHWKTAEEELKQPVKGIKYAGTEYQQLDVLNNGNPGLVDPDGFLIVEGEANRTFVAPKHYLYSVPLTQMYINPQLRPNNPGW
ncbi:MAG: RagB/SusD family nutrient uptake outer membrane protein [Tannerellaceae bacterium]|nr:RagB/SusD family nutrient uptake outer membrane protein [Tannerellaceae bacterium]